MSLLSMCFFHEQIRAVLTGALTMSDGTTLNTATELNAFVYNTIAGWYALNKRKACLHSWLLRASLLVRVDSRCRRPEAINLTLRPNGL